MVEKCDSICRVFTKARHDSLAEAISADIVDLIPALGNVSSLLRSKSLQAEDSVADNLAYVMYVIDSIPILSELTDAIIPLNTLRYLTRPK